MKKVASLDEYSSLARQAKTGAGASATNCFLMPDAVRRYISLGRFFYETTEAGLLLFSDEEAFYEVFYYLNPEKPLEVRKAGKPLLLRNIYAEGRKNGKLLAEEERISEAGFFLSDTMKQIKADPEQVLAKLRPLTRYPKRLTAADGLIFGKLEKQDFPSLFALLHATPEIPYYQVPYFTEEELLEQCDAGLIVGIKDREGHLAAARHSLLEGKAIYGWLAVSEAYKKQYGMALLFSEYLMDFAIQNQYCVSGWIDEKNEPSIRYHTSIGYEFTGRCMDEWLLPERQ